jgi:vacuolar-type H+-ATPase subunit H
MSAAKPIVDAQLQHLLEVVDRRREEHCARVREEAQAQARQIVRQARRETRSRAHENLLELREQIRQQLVSADARQRTRQRQQRQQVEQALINTAWQQLPGALQRLWDDRNTRRRWVNELVRQASTTLINAHWCIEHPPDWPGQECNDLKARLSNEFDCFPGFEAQSAVAAGLRITAGGACVDGSIDGLLQGRTRVEAMLLARIREQRSHET